MNTPQNGTLLRTDIHELWDSYGISVNPYHDYRVQSFVAVAHEFHGSVLHTTCRQRPQLAVLNRLLRWHYEQAVLCNIRGVGEDICEFDFPPGTDMIGTIIAGLRPVEQMEAEMSNRLHDWEDTQSISDEE